MDITKARRLLSEEKARLQGDIDSIEDRDSSQTQSEESGEESGYDNHPADAGTATFEREKDLALLNTVELLMQKVDRALEKIEEKTYGTCDRCGKPIGDARLDALPSATLCLACQDVEDAI